LEALVRSRTVARCIDAAHAGSIFFAPYLIQALHLATGARVRNEPSRITTKRSRAIWDEAVRRNISIKELVFFGFASDFYRARMKGRWQYFQTFPLPTALEAHSFMWADDKFLFKLFLGTHHIPTARGFAATTLPIAQAQLKNLKMPVVVKPRIGSNSRHTTKLVQTTDQFDMAFKSAQQLCQFVMVEEHIEGDVYRATVVGGKLSGFLMTRSPSVSGDGTRTVRELIDEKNSHRREGVGKIIIADENEAYIKRQGYDLDSILQNGRIVTVGRYGGRSSGGETREMLHEIHPKLRQVVETTAQLMKCPLVGFDLIIADAKRDPDSQQWGILEANTVPFIEIHNDPLYGKPSNVAAAVWNLWKV
jgi:D-alanine-D-alanine ligase-like ATP-grasp enzyme